MLEHFGALEPRALTAKKLNLLVARIKALEEALSGVGEKAEEKPSKKKEKKADATVVAEEASE